MSIYKRTTPEQREAEREKLRKQFDKVLVSIRRAFATPDGQVALRFIMEQSSFEDSAITLDPNSKEILPLASAYNEGRRAVYLDLRSLLTPEILMGVEFPKKEEPIKED